MAMVRRSHTLATCGLLLAANLLLSIFRGSHAWIGAPASSRRSHKPLFSSAEDEFSFLATCIPGLSEVLTEELSSFGASSVVTSGDAAATFRATREASLRVLLRTRVAHRIMELVVSTEEFGDKETCVLYDRDELYSFVYDQVDAAKLLSPNLSLSVRTVLNRPEALPKDLCHSHYSAMTIKRALCDKVGENQVQVHVDVEDPDVPLFGILRGLERGAASLSLYRCLHSPASLHKRGYRRGDDTPVHRAAMKESLAAGLLYHAGWPDKATSSFVIDPMAGSGTLVLEAALMAADVDPGLLRIKCHPELRAHRVPPAVRWDESSIELWKDLLSDSARRAKEGVKSCEARFLANEAHPGAIELLEDSVARSGMASLIRVTRGDCRDLELPSNASTEGALVVTNPPWGVRLGDDVEQSWDSLRYFLRDTCPPGTDAWVLIGGGGTDEGVKPSQLHKTASARLRMKRQGGNSMLSLRTGSQHLRWINYKIGSAKQERPVSNDWDVPTTASRLTIRTTSSSTFVPQQPRQKPRRR